METMISEKKGESISEKYDPQIDIGLSHHPFIGKGIPEKEGSEEYLDEGMGFELKEVCYFSGEENT